MRDLVFRTLNIPEARKRDISLTQVEKKSGFISTVIKRSTYFIRDACVINTKEDFEKWKNDKIYDPALKKKSFNIIKTHSDREGSDKVFCKARGTFFIVVGKCIYNIVFIHSVKMEMQVLSNKEAEL